ncbi:SDR family NAD(P)-dependent oxidoreductase [Thermogladius sp. 4427co]|uniref:SDR family NAD(P)-dependent oxidoreductase n=1 Tax=Thermogladius sp. 4427co TaxID=3450718 RepID=UPI003F7ACED5
MSGYILVTGGAGFIGSHIVDKLVEKGYKVRVIDNLSSGRLENLARYKNNPMVDIIIGDLKNPGDISKALEGVETVFHFAANPEVRVSTTNPEIHFSENIVATFNLLEAMRRKNVREIVFASSSSVYGEPAEIPVGEESPIRPVSVYGASKASCEALLHAYTVLYGFRSIIIRYANIVGPRLRHGVIWDFLVKLSNNPSELEILGDGNQVRSYMYVSDAVDATLTVWEKEEERYSIYNVGSADWISVNEVAGIVIETIGLGNVKIRYKPIAHGIGWPGDVKRIALKIDKLRSIGFNPRFNSRQSVRRTVEELLSETGLFRKT